MKTISDYIIYCTEEQTKKALELGAPIYHSFPNMTMKGNGWFQHQRLSYLCPTSEQMIGWLEDKGLVLHIYPIYRGNDYCIGYKFSCEEIERNMYSDIFPSRKEVTLAAIDAALEYLEQQKK